MGFCTSSNNNHGNRNSCTLWLKKKKCNSRPLRWLEGWSFLLNLRQWLAAHSSLKATCQTMTWLRSVLVGADCSWGSRGSRGASPSATTVPSSSPGGHRPECSASHNEDYKTKVTGLQCSYPSWSRYSPPLHSWPAWTWNAALLRDCQRKELLSLGSCYQVLQALLLEEQPDLEKKNQLLR